MPTGYPKPSPAASRTPFRCSCLCRGWSRAYTHRRLVISLRCSRTSIPSSTSRSRRRRRCPWPRSQDNFSGLPRPREARMQMRSKSTSSRRGALNRPARTEARLLGLLALAVGEKSAERAAREEQRLLRVVSIGLDCTEKDHVVAAVIAIDRAALKIGDALGEHRPVAEARRPVDTGELVIRRLGEFARKRLLRNAKNVDREMTGVLEDGQTRGIDDEAPKNQRRIQRDRGKRIARQAIGLAVRRSGCDDRHPRGVGA